MDASVSHVLVPARFNHRLAGFKRTVFSASLIINPHLAGLIEVFENCPLERIAVVLVRFKRHLVEMKYRNQGRVESGAGESDSYEAHCSDIKPHKLTIAAELKWFA